MGAQVATQSLEASVEVMLPRSVPPDVPVPTAPDIHMHLNRGLGSKLGMLVHINLESGLLSISQVQPGGMVEAWNEQRPAEERVRGGEWIVSVNGVSETTGSIFRQLQSVGALEIVVSRRPPPSTSLQRGPLESSLLSIQELAEPQRIPLTVHVNERMPIGVEVTVLSDAFTIAEIREGAVKQWNRQHPTKEVCVGDRIVFANGVSKERLFNEIFRPGVLHLVVQRGKDGAAFPEAFAEQLLLVVSQGCSVRDEEGDICAICHDGFEPVAQVAQLPCKHCFHRDCVVPWLTKHSPLCPLCGWAADHPGGGGGDEDKVDALPPTMHKVPRMHSKRSALGK